MNDSGTRSKTKPSSSWAEPVRLTCPTSWDALTQSQLRYILTLLSLGIEGVQLKTAVIIRLSGVKVVKRDTRGWTFRHENRLFRLTADQIASWLPQMDFLDQQDALAFPLDDIQGLHAVESRLHGVPFYDYLRMEIAWQGYLATRKDEPLLSLAHILYRDAKGRTVPGWQPSKAELMGVVLWYASIKKTLAVSFPDFFKPASGGDYDSYDIRNATDAQIRILTDGDITKERDIFNADCWRALTELNARAREAAEMRRQMNTKP